MITIKRFNTLRDFLNYNKEFIHSNYFGNYLFRIQLGQLGGSIIKAKCALNIVDNLGNSIVFIQIEAAFFIYSDSWTDECVEALGNEFKSEKIINAVFSGSKELILQLLLKLQLQYEVYKDRLIYECDKVIPASKEKVGKTFNASGKEFEELVKMTLENFKEEYAGKREKTIDQASAEIIKGIMEAKLYYLRYNGIIASMVQIINDDETYVMIGNLFTKKDFRGKGCAFSILHTVTEGYLKNSNKKCGLVSDLHNSTSNRIFSNIGYNAIDDQISVIIQ